MTFATFDKPHVQEALDYLVESTKLAVFVGAGASAEAGMPNWSLLIQRLLKQAAERIPAFSHDLEREAWVKRTVSTEVPPAAAGIAEVLLGPDLPTALRRAVFTPQHSQEESDPGDFMPGPTAHAIAALRLACVLSDNHESKMRIFTTNYDELIEKAFQTRSEVKRSLVQSVVYPTRAQARGGPNHIRIRHLNGYFPNTGGSPRGTLTLTDESFNLSDAAVADRDDYVIDQLADRERSCLFLGTSFTDPNIIRYIDKSAERQKRSRTAGQHHVAIFTHHTDEPRHIQQVREEVTRRRLEKRLTKVVYLDHYADVPAFVYELRNRLLNTYVAPCQERARETLQMLLGSVIASHDRSRYDEAQPALNDRLVEILGATVSDIDGTLGTQLAGEDLAMAIWLLDATGTSLTPWITTDRIHRGPHLLQAAVVEPGSRWLAVKAVCEGRLLKEPRDDTRSRWRYLLAFPLEISGDSDEAVAIGAVSLTSLTPEGETGLSQLGLRGEHLLRKELGGAVSGWLAGLGDSVRK